MGIKKLRVKTSAKKGTNRKILSKKIETFSFSRSDLEKDILKEAKSIEIPSGEAKGFAKKVAEKVAKWVEKRSEVTEDDVNQRVACEIKKYSSDLAFLYKQRGKII